MQIDWVTTVAQVINFLVLVALLRHFLYGPITHAMAERQERIAERMHEAEAREREAQERAEEHELALRELEERREEVLEGARRAADEERERLADEARREVAALDRRWHEALRDEQRGFLDELRRRLGEQLCGLARQALGDLASADLQTQMVAVFVDRLAHLNDREREELRTGLREDSGPVRVITAFELPAEQREHVRRATRELLGTDGEVDFVRADELLCGIELGVGGRKLGWSIDSYLDRLAESITEMLDRATEAHEAPEDRAHE